MIKNVIKKRGYRAGLSEEKCADIAAEQASKGGDKQQTVKPVQNAAMAGEQTAVILDTKTAFYCRHGKIAKLTEY